MYGKLKIAALICVVLGVMAAPTLADEGRWQVGGDYGALVPDEGFDNDKYLGSVRVEIDPITGKGNVAFIHPVDSIPNLPLEGAKGGGVPGVVNDYFDLLGVSCVDCGTSCTPGGSTREIVVTVQQNGESGSPAVNFVEESNLTTGGGAGAALLHTTLCDLGQPEGWCWMMPEDAVATVDVVVEIDACETFEVYFDLIGLPMEPALPGFCPCYEASDLAALSFDEPIECTNAGLPLDGEPTPNALPTKGIPPAWGFGTAPLLGSPPPYAATWYDGSNGGCFETGGTIIPTAPEEFLACNCNVLYNALERGLECDLPFFDPFLFAYSLYLCAGLI